MIIQYTFPKTSLTIHTVHTQYSNRLQTKNCYKHMTEIFWTLCYYTLSRQLYGTDDVCGFVHQKAFRQGSRDQARQARQAPWAGRQTGRGPELGKTERRPQTLLMGHFYCCRQPLKIKYPIVEKEKKTFSSLSFVQNLGNKLRPVLSCRVLLAYPHGMCYLHFSNGVMGQITMMGFAHTMQGAQKVLAGCPLSYK